MLARLVTGYQVRDDRQTPHAVLHTGPHRVLRRYGPPASAADRPPVLLVPPLAVSARCYDLGPEQSVVAELAAMGRLPYVVDFGDVSRADAHLGFADYFDDIVPEAIARTLADSGADRLDLVGWSLGGTISLLTAAAHPDLPIRSITAVGTPLDYDAIPPYPAVKRALPPGGTAVVTETLRALGGIPAPLVRLGYRATAWERELRKPAYIVAHADDADALARMQVIDRFQSTMPGYPGRAAVQMWQNFVYRNELAGGVVDFGDRRVDLTALVQPVQLFGSHRDAIASWRAAHHGVEVLTGAAQVHFETVEASHLGLIVGAAATAETWPRVAEFLAALDAADGDSDNR
ncbi:alpha/beta fold hydrolase [Skermania piniformis]|uniref:Alpha/beta fold hydrolase n=1 Tax=Skermania pinensis TaxID=39122 RepID=A0ABX8SDQ5_9ACTN|nr:alpha/beta fold hydrolase [Skermania piniformis]QXQ15998.1 alpha/beta fold hydrolase [Skermania piniformis]